MKIIRYIKIFVFVLVALSILDFMNPDINSAGRFQFYDFESARQLRAWTDVILLLSLIVMAIKTWSDKRYGILYWTAASAYILLISLDLNEWVWLTYSMFIYYIIITIHTLPILIILHDLLSKISAKKIFIIGLLFIFLGVVYDIVFINIPAQDPTPEMIDRGILDQRILGWLYYLGAVVTTLGITNLIDSVVQKNRE